MNTIIYLVRHSKPMEVNNDFNNESLQIQNEKKCLSIEGEFLAREIFENSEFNNINILFSSSYVRTIQTAKYLAKKNNLDINIVSDLGERRFGIDSWNDLPENFERKQLLDENYKLNNGESQKDVRNRMYMVIMKILNKYQNKKIAIVSHGTAITYLLKKWCNIELVDDRLRYRFNDKVFFRGYLNYCEIFKLEFDDNNELISIENVDCGKEEKSK